MAQELYIQATLVPLVPFSLFQKLDVATYTPSVRPRIILAGIPRKPFLSWKSGQVPADKCHEAWAMIATFNSSGIVFHELWTGRDLVPSESAYGSTFSRKPRERALSGLNVNCARIDGCNVLLGSFWMMRCRFYFNFWRILSHTGCGNTLSIETGLDRMLSLEK